MEYAIEVQNITKSFKIYLDKGSQLKERVLFRGRNRYEERKVLKGISFQIPRGQAVGLIGVNGCGKSTTLKMLTKILYPDSGTITMRGRVSSLIELGAGFHPDMSGRENIYINASIFGLKRSEIDARLQTIIDFSELGEYIDNPVRTYSSGMYMRLAFSVAISVDADILLVDEVLAVGDTNFQHKCLDKLTELKESGVTIIIVSHDSDAISEFCDRAIWLRDGLICQDGLAEPVVEAYQDYMRELRGEEKPDAEIDYNPPTTLNMKYNHFGTGEVLIKEVRLIGASGEEQETFAYGESMTIELVFERAKPRYREDLSYVFGVGFNSEEGLVVFGNNTREDSYRFDTLPDHGVLSCHIPKLALSNGRYSVNASIIDEEQIPIDFYKKYKYFQVTDPANKGIGVLHVDKTWELDGQKPPVGEFRPLESLQELAPLEERLLEVYERMKSETAD